MPSAPLSDPIVRLAGGLADRYRIEREIGQGGMATVYRALDVKHDRPVAMKVLRPDLAAVIGPERFLAEIKTTAHLQHAHILGLIDSGQVAGTVFYVMPFVDGESLRERLAREKQLPIADAVRIATDVAGALDYAHRRGVIHRDIKPENILLHEGQPLVADFGIALAMTQSGDGKRITESGMSVGTPQYMSPEQAMGERSVDARTDVYALGCVLYEMITGEPPFNGPTAQAITAKVMSVDPLPVATLRRSVPANVAAATMTALNKIPADRFATAADFAEALRNPRYVAPEIAAKRAARTLPRGKVRDVVGGAAIVVLATVAVAGWLRHTRVPANAVARFEISVPDSIFNQQVALGGDGSRLVWATPSGYYERRLDSLSIRRVRDATPPMITVRGIAPSGGDVLVSGRGSIAIVPLSGGTARTLIATGGRGGAAWVDDGSVLFGFQDQRTQTRGIARVPPTGGPADTLVKTDAIPAEIVALPGGRGLIVTLVRNGVSQLNALDLRTRTLHKLDVIGSFAQFIEPGYLMFARGASIMVAPFDADKLALTAPPVALFDVPSGGITTLAATGNMLVYAPVPEPLGSRVVVRSRTGRVQPLPNVPDTLRLSAFAVSPDGRRFAASGGPTPGGPVSSNLYIYELSSGRLTRLRSDQRDLSPSWLPNGRDLSFVRVSADTPTTSTLMRRAWDGSTPAVPILQRPGGGGRGGSIGPAAWLPDGRHAILRVTGGSVGGGRGGPPGDLMRLSLDAPAKLDTVVATEYGESNPAVSPNGRLLAFTSDESGRPEVYVRPIDGGALRRVSLNGGSLPKWSHSGKELFYAESDTLFAADIQDGSDLSAGEVRMIFQARNLNQGGYAVLPGDTSFVTPAVPTTNVLVIVINIAKELEQLFAARPR